MVVVSTSVVMPRSVVEIRRMLPKIRNNPSMKPFVDVRLRMQDFQQIKFNRVASWERVIFQPVLIRQRVFRNEVEASER